MREPAPNAAWRWLTEQARNTFDGSLAGGPAPMTLADPKPVRRIRDPELMKELVDAGESGLIPCILCDFPYTEPHHVLLRSRGGDDVPDNIAYLCGNCHRGYHSSNAEHLRFKLGRWLYSQKGRYARSYLIGKLGRGSAESFMRREFGVRL